MGLPDRELQRERDDLKRQLQTLRVAVEAAAPRAAVPPPYLSAARTDPQFFAEATRLGLDHHAVQRLLGLVGPSPGRVGDPAAKGYRAPVDKPAGAVPPPPADPDAMQGVIVAKPTPAPLPDMVSLLVQQNQLLMTMLQNKSSGSTDPLSALLGGPASGDLLDESRVGGARGCAARALLREQMLKKPGAVTSAVRRTLCELSTRAPRIQRTSGPTSPIMWRSETTAA